MRLHVESIDEAAAMLKLAHKYDMPGPLESAKEYLMPGLQNIKVTQDIRQKQQ